MPVALFLAVLLSAASAQTDTVAVPLTATATGYRTVTLLWPAASSPAARLFTVCRQYPSDTAPVPVATRGGGTYVDTLRRAVCFDTVRYVVSCLDGAHCYYGSASLYVADARPTTPCSLRSVSVDSATQRICLAWNPSPDSDIMGYFICSGTPCLGLDTVWGRLTTSYLAPPSLSAAQRNTFRLYAFDSCLTASALTDPLANLVLQAEAIRCGRFLSVGWTPSSPLPQGLSCYELQAATAEGAAFSALHRYPASCCSDTLEAPSADGYLLLRLAALGPADTAYSNTVRLRPPSRLAAPRYLHLIRAGASPDAPGVVVGCMADTAYKAQPYTLWRKAETPSGHAASSRPDGTVLSDGNGWLPIAQFNAASSPFYLTDTVAPASTAFCHYRLTVVDSCGTSTATSNELATPLLHLDRSDWRSLSLSWLVPDSAATACLLLRRCTDDLHPNHWQPVAMTTATQFVDNLEPLGPIAAPLQYQLMVLVRPTDSAGLDTVLSNIVQYEREASLFVPNAFCPDDANPAVSQFCVSHTFLKESGYSLSVYSRQGLRLFHTTDPSQCWDGTSGGRPLPPGSYVYTITYSQNGTDRQTQTGTVTIIK